MRSQETPPDASLAGFFVFYAPPSGYSTRTNYVPAAMGRGSKLLGSK